MTPRKPTPLKKVVAAAIAVVLVLLVLLPLLHEFLDVFGASKDSTDSVVRAIIEWALAALLVAGIYTCIVDGPRALARMWTGRKGITRR